MKTNIDIMLFKAGKEDKFKRADLVLERASKTGFVEMYTMECTKWNYPDNGKNTELPKEDGTFDVEGHSCSDIQAVWDVRWWERRHWHTIKDSVINYLEGIKEFIIDDFKFWIKKEPKYLFKKMKDWLFINPFKVQQEGWVWVVDSLSASMKSAAYELADDLISIEQGFESSIERFTRTGKINEVKKVQARADELMATEAGRHQVFLHMVKEDNLVKVTDYMWVNENDPTCFVIDDNFMPFNMKNGWSPEMLTKVISYWFRVFYGVDVTVKVKENR
jgi:hypothetical protein